MSSVPTYGRVNVGEKFHTVAHRDSHSLGQV
jgi:hypothetical protein